MESSGTLLLKQQDVASLLTIDECMGAVAKVFCLNAKGEQPPPKVLGLHSEKGGLHIKAGISGYGRNYFVAKLNANFSDNPKLHSLPVIQGVLVVCDAVDGRLLALMDSIEITIIRTGAATGVAANYLSLPNATVATICGCGNQGRISLKALMKIRKLKKVFAYDIDKEQTNKFMLEFRNTVQIIPVERKDLSTALQQSQIIITCTPSKEPFVRLNDVLPGTFIAAVGADNESKSELFPELVVSSKLVTDMTEQCVSIGELHHALESKMMMPFEVHAELGEIIAQKKQGRESDEEIIIFDSTGTALQDVAAAAIVYEKAVANGIGERFHFSGINVYDEKKKSDRKINSLRYWYPFR